MKISVVILSYNSADKVASLLDALARQTNRDFGIIVVDNRSEEEDKNKLWEHIQKIDRYITFTESPENLGYAGGNNLGLKEAFGQGSDWALILNPDTMVESDFVAHLKQCFANKRGIAGLPLQEGGKITYGGRIKWLKPELDHVKEINTHDYVIGAALAVSKDAYRQLGPLDENYFLYFEDADYSLMAERQGLDMSYCAAPIVHHQSSSTTKKLGDPLLLRYHFRNALYFNVKNGPLLVKLLVWPWSVLILVKQTIKILLKKEAASSRAIEDGVLDFYLGRMGRIRNT